MSLHGETGSPSRTSWRRFFRCWSGLERRSRECWAARGGKGRQGAVRVRRTRAQVRDYVVHKFDQDLPPAELAGVQAAYRLFGLLPDSVDLRRTMIDLLTEQVAGYYDPDSSALYVPVDIDPAQARIV